MSAGKNIAIGCGVIILAMVLAGWLGFRWVQDNLGITWDDEKLVTWSVEMIGTTPPPGFDAKFGMFTGEDKQEALLIFVKPVERGSSISLTMMSRPGFHDFDSVFQDIETSDDGGVYIKFQSNVGEGEEYTADWDGVPVPVKLEEGYDEDDLLSRQLTAILPVLDHSVVLFFQGDPEELDRDIVQEMLDRIPDGWQPQSILAPIESE